MISHPLNVDPAPHDTLSAPPTKVLVVGAGAVGCYYGAKLAAAGAQVSTVHRSDYPAVAAHGIAFDSIDGAFHFRPHRVLRQVSEYGEAPDYLLLTAKVLPGEDPVRLIGPAVTPDTVIVLLQNGVEIEAPVAQAFPHNELLSALAFICVHRTAPGQIRHLCFGRLALGPYPSGDSARAQRLTALFRQGGVPCHTSTNIVTDRWRKLVWNAPFNPISVLNRATTRQIMENPATQALARRVMEEVLAIAAACGHPLTPEIVERNLEDTLRMEAYKTSMLLDFEAGREMEVEAILGHALAAARNHGVHAPCMETLHALLLGLAPNTLQNNG